MRAELKDCNILCIAFGINNIKRIPLEVFYKQGYWITEIFGDKCYLVKKRVNSSADSMFSCQMRYCELTEKGREFVKKYSEAQYKKYKKYLDSQWASKNGSMYEEHNI